MSVRRIFSWIEIAGHPVPENKIRGRCIRNSAIIRKAVLIAALGLIFDSSVNGRAPRLVLRFWDDNEVTCTLPQNG